MYKESHSVLHTGAEGSHIVCTKKGKNEKNGKFTVESWIACKKSHISVVSSLSYAFPMNTCTEKIATTNVKKRVMVQS